MIKSYKDYLTEAEQSLGPQPGDYLHLITEDGVTSIQLDEGAPLIGVGGALRAIFQAGVRTPRQLANLLKWPLDKAKDFLKKHKGKLGLGVGAGAGASAPSPSSDADNKAAAAATAAAIAPGSRLLDSSDDSSAESLSDSCAIISVAKKP